MNLVNSAPEYLAIGHLARDVVPGGYRLGGTAAFAALTAQALGLRAGIVTSLAADVDLPELASLAVHRRDSPQSTIFHNQYSANGRTQVVHGRAAPLTPAEIPDGWHQPQIVHLAPILQEVTPELCAHFKSAFIGVTPQGWMRQCDPAGLVKRRAWIEAGYVLARASAAVISIEDVQGNWAEAEAWAALARVFVVTQGERGATVFAGGRRQQVRAPQVQAVDPTGAGDIFAASFFVRLHQTADPLAAAQFAAHVASDSVTRVGLAGVPAGVSAPKSQ